MKFIKSLVLMFLILSLFLLSSCSNKNENNEDSITAAEVIPSKLTIGMYSPASYNPLDTLTVYNEQAFLLMYDSLYNINEKFEAVKNLSTDLTIENGGNTAILQIKPNVKFHNGEMLNAADVKYTIDYILSNGGYYSYNVRNIGSVDIVNNYTLKLNLKYHTPNLENQLVFPIIKENSTRLNGTGPYKLLTEKIGKQLDLIKFGEYHSQFNSVVNRVEINLIPDKITARSLSGSGILDIFFAAFSDEGLKTVTKSQSLKKDYITDSYVFLRLNYENPLLNLKPVRRAISLAINRQKIADEAYMTHAEPTALPVPYSSLIYNSSLSADQMQADALKLMEQAGYKDTDSDGISENINYNEDTENGLPKNPVLKLLIKKDTLNEAVAENIVYDLKKLGIRVDITALDKEAYETSYNENKYDMCLVNTQAGLDLDNTAFLGEGGIFSSPINYNFSDTLTKLGATSIFDLKKPSFTSLYTSFYENPAHIPLVFLKNTLITNDKFKDTTDIYINNIYYKILLGKEN